MIKIETFYLHNQVCAARQILKAARSPVRLSGCCPCEICKGLHIEALKE